MLELALQATPEVACALMLLCVLVIGASYPGLSSNLDGVT
jgi:hypothetical protein